MTVALISKEGTPAGPVFDYFPYGKQKEEVVTPEKITQTFTGKEFDLFEQDTTSGDDGEGWYYFGARYYDADVGLWTAVDPAGEYYSPYTYVGNNPIAAIDPNGLWTLKAGFGLGYAVTGKLGYNNGRWTFGLGGGEGAGAVVSYDPSTSISHADQGLAAQLGLSADLKLGIGKANIGGNLEATARSDMAGNFVNKVKGELSIPVGKNGSMSITPFYEIGEQGNLNDGTLQSFDNKGVGAKASYGAFQFIGAEVEVSGTKDDFVNAAKKVVE